MGRISGRRRSSPLISKRHRFGRFVLLDGRRGSRIVLARSSYPGGWLNARSLKKEMSRRMGAMTKRDRRGYDDVAVATPVTIPYVRYSTRGAHWFAAGALPALLERSGLDKKPWTACVLELHRRSPTRGRDDPAPGSDGRWLDHIPMGGVAGIVALRRALRAVQSGGCHRSGLLAADTHHLDSFRLRSSQISASSRATRSIPTAPEGECELRAPDRLHMSTFGARAEDFGKLCVAQRENASRFPFCAAVEEALDPGDTERAPDCRAAAVV